MDVDFMTDFKKLQKYSLYSPAVTRHTSNWKSNSCQTRCSRSYVTFSSATVIPA